MSRILIVAVLGLVSAMPLAVADESRLPRSSPESQGVSSKAIREFVETANQKIDTLHSFMLVGTSPIIDNRYQLTVAQARNTSGT